MTLIINLSTAIIFTKPTKNIKFVMVNTKLKGKTKRYMNVHVCIICITYSYSHQGFLRHNPDDLLTKRQWFIDFVLCI